MVKPSLISLSEAKKFSRYRKKVYSESPLEDSSLYDYIYPRIRYNMKERVLPRCLPRWAEVNALLYDNLSSGTLTVGLCGEEIMQAVCRQKFAGDPFRARATGGYSILTEWRSLRPPSQEWLDLAECLMRTNPISTVRVKRSDLPQAPSMMNDPLYEHTNLFEYLTVIGSKRKKSQSVYSDSPSEVKRIRLEVLESLPNLIHTGKVNTLADIVTQVNNRLGDTFNQSQISNLGSDYGLESEDDSYYAEGLDIDLLTGTL